MTEQSERRDREVERRSNRATNPLLGSPFESKLVGVTYVDGYPDLFHQILDNMTGGPIQWATLHREPSNEHDPSAIRIDWEGMTIGHLTRVTAARMAPELDAGIEWLAFIKEVPVQPGEEDKPGIIVRFKREE